MTGQGKPKRKALHRGLDDIVNRDASLTSKLLGRVKSPVREPLEVTPPEDSSPQGAEPTDRPISGRAVESRGAINPAPRPPAPTASIHRFDVSRPQDVAELQEVPEREVVSRQPASSEASPTFDQFAERWGFILRSGVRAGKLRICEVLYNNTYAVGKDSFFTSYEKLAKLTGLEKKQCAINVRQLEGLGFVERLDIYNTATKQGTEFKLHLEQLPTNARKLPRHHHYDEELKAES
jgi:hypothetical protein